MKPCPYCAEQIEDAAVKCKHCGEYLDPALRAARQAPNNAEQMAAAQAAHKQKMSRLNMASWATAIIGYIIWKAGIELLGQGLVFLGIALAVGVHLQRGKKVS